MILKLRESMPLSSELQSKLDEAKQRLPEMKVEEVNLKHPGNFRNGVQQWKIQTKGKAFAALLGAFFKLAIVLVINGAIKWVQPLIRAKTERAEDQKGNGIDVAGLVVDIYDREGNLAVRMGNEPGAQKEIFGEKEIHPKIQPTMQTSIAKLAAVRAGDKDKDKGMAILLDIFDEKKWSFDELEWVLSDAMHDTNRIEGAVVYASIVVEEDELADIAAKIGGFVLTPDDVDELIDKQPSMFNPHSLFPA